MFWLQLVVIVALLAAVGWLAIGGGGHMSEPVPDHPDLALPGQGLLERGDVDRVRFSVGARGYRMDEVDDVLDRLAREIELREERIAELEEREYATGPSRETAAESATRSEPPESALPENAPNAASETAPAAQAQPGTVG
jgi:DivIVA domain-containing protein